MLRLAPFALMATLAGTVAWAQAPAGTEFQVNTYTTGYQGWLGASLSPLGRFVVSWSSPAYPDSQVFARRFLDAGAPSGGEFRVNTTDFAETSAFAARHLDGLVAVWSTFDGIRGQRYAPSWTPEGAEFRVSSSTSGMEYGPAVAPLPGGGFVVAWSAPSGYEVAQRILVRRFDARGLPLGPELQANATATMVSVYAPSIASAADGRFVVVWHREALPVDFVFGRAFDAAGNPAGNQFSASSLPALGFTDPGVAMAADGGYVVVWHNEIDTGLPPGIRARWFSPPNTPVGQEFEVNEPTTARVRFPSVAAGAAGDFVVAWTVYPTAGPPSDVLARRFAAGGAPRGGEFRVNTYTTGTQYRGAVASDPAGNFVVAWMSYGQDGSDTGVFAQRFGGMLPTALDVDTAASGPSDGNRVLEPGETVDVRPWWRNVTGQIQFFDGTLPGFEGPSGATYTVGDATAAYGSVPHTGSRTCSECYAVGVSAPPQRPVRHWDAVAREHLLPEAQGQRQRWTLHVGDTFVDVPRTGPFYRFVETLVHHRVTTGCAEAQYCPPSPVTREQMAVFVLVARDRAGDPPPACGTPVFADVPASSPFCRWIEELARRGVVAGCSGGSYCPSAPVSREQMAVFVLRTLDPTLEPPACTTPLFSDVPADSPFCRWIEELARRGVVGGCAAGRYCPLDPVTREQMAVFITEGFGLRLYGP